MPKILVVGGNAAGMTAASRARRLDPRAEITVIEKTPFISYSTCGIPYFLAGDVRSDDLLSFTPGTLKSERSIDAHVNVEVASILPSRKRVTARRIDTGEKLSFSFDRLLLATGVRPRLPDIPGTSLANVHTVTTLDDAVRLEGPLEVAHRVSIVGAGYVGLEMAESLRSLGKEVTIFESGAHVLSSVDPDMARIIEYELLRHRVSLRTGSPVQALVGPEPVTGVKARGVLGVHPTDLVLIDTGVLPNTTLAEEAGIRTGDTCGVVVDEYMETNVPGVFAAGNCAESFCFIRRKPVLHYLGTVAAKQGRVAGDNLTGRRQKFRGALGTTVLKVFDLAVGRTGLNLAEAAAEGIPTVSVRIEALDRAGYRADAKKIWVKLIADRSSRRVIGAQAVGYGDVSKRIDVAATAMMASATVDAITELDLGYTPPYSSLWDPLHVAAQALLKKL